MRTVDGGKPEMMKPPDGKGAGGVGCGPANDAATRMYSGNGGAPTGGNVGIICALTSPTNSIVVPCIGRHPPTLFRSRYFWSSWTSTTDKSLGHGWVTPGSTTEMSPVCSGPPRAATAIDEGDGL